MPDVADHDLRGLLELMLLIREFEPEAERQYKKARIGGYCHLATGQEAATVGAVAAMQEDDYLLASYREHPDSIELNMQGVAACTRMQLDRAGFDKLLKESGDEIAAIQAALGR